MTRGLIFDLDGTLVESLPGIATALNQALEEAGYATHVEADIRRFIGDGVRELVRRALGGHATEESVDTLEAGFTRCYDLAWRNGTIVFSGIPELLVRLQAAGRQLAVLSNKPHGFTVEIVTALFPGVSFDAVLGQRPDVPKKPNPAGALEITRLWGLDPSDCAVVGDSTMDLDTARHAGMHTVAVAWGYHDPEALLAAGAERVVADVAQLEIACL